MTPTRLALCRFGFPGWGAAWLSLWHSTQHSRYNTSTASPSHRGTTLLFGKQTRGTFSIVHQERYKNLQSWVLILIDVWAHRVKGGRLYLYNSMYCMPRSELCALIIIFIYLTEDGGRAKLSKNLCTSPLTKIYWAWATPLFNTGPFRWSVPLIASSLLGHAKKLELWPIGDNLSGLNISILFAVRLIYFLACVLNTVAMMSACLMLVFVVLLPAGTYVGRYHIMVIIILGAAMLGEYWSACSYTDKK